MGCSASCKRYIPRQALVNPHDIIGRVITIPGACAFAGQGRYYMEHLIPDNGEYQWAGEGKSCHFCSLLAPYSTNCSMGCAETMRCVAIIGNSGTYTRVRYNGNAERCCLFNNRLIYDHKIKKLVTCHPSLWNYRSVACNYIMKPHCRKGNRIFTDSRCIAWCAYHERNFGQCNSIKKEKCNNYSFFVHNRHYCINFCRNNPGNCDNSFSKYCLINHNTPECSCITSDFTKYQYNPICQDRACIDTGYQPASMHNAAKTGGCNIISCSTYFDLTTRGDINFTDVGIIKRCTTDTSTTGEPTAKERVEYDNVENDNRNSPIEDERKLANQYNTTSTADIINIENDVFGKGVVSLILLITRILKN